MDKKTLEAFLRLYEKKSLRQAAAELYISPPRASAASFRPWRTSWT